MSPQDDHPPLLVFGYLQGAEVVHEAPVFYVVEVLFSDDVCVDDLPALDAPDVGLDQAGGGRLQLGWVHAARVGALVVAVFYDVVFLLSVANGR